jgi:MOSC domain-containing protein YiiM
MTSGTLHSINVSNGGVPKHPRAAAWVSNDGVEGDRQKLPFIHGGPKRAVSLYSLDLIRTLQQEGHPIVPGSIGENMTLEGVDWSLLVPGARLQVGDVELEVTGFATPCLQIAGSFADRQSNRVSQKLHPGWSRVYTRVLSEGRVAAGDRVLITPV